MIISAIEFQSQSQKCFIAIQEKVYIDQNNKTEAHSGLFVINLIHQLAVAAGCLPPIVSVFENGVVYKYAPGRTLTANDLNDPHIIRYIWKYPVYPLI